MKYMGQEPKIGCQCHYCIGRPWGETKRRMRKRLKSRERQDVKKQIQREANGQN
jgi:hypothetical protein